VPLSVLVMLPDKRHLTVAQYLHTARSHSSHQ